MHCRWPLTVLNWTCLWREAFLDAGQEALQKQPLDSRDREEDSITNTVGS
jgi:hypothetical protein